ncbi:MAG: bifunctional (p)ppGpp synthetase/guanosine-3',5'-bis(diphosphate) 3'-pyrophosphohydrolase [Chloroflexi bacterium]|nr:bifunctional (p)ppGpp synthetase/guanosine-3',5'-bis(diphosphate) 3'-pyrophosphohydrolase [Chloroflexota bacterium]MCI0805256.1 bifunctional (p)ppGpp synthetase/guanosine-3',5'-bis(diphosphate) 3'-pyrophosphohydrolase [Chloroflexota bacterium]MCI0826708.1 bifunctional (p)ppGpp synthetase/guanosine-3',5'-bis(diphosphate) 3'-pyrophosphohydrolase [Chloroflexota bacterium]MCI0892304.1 bifunctional (p)ppGpp synthetase/guanosine-3',5'-bis(diphosphate) 3'-pyrophosphohydrolase [Chloroflexota bacteriu
MKLERLLEALPEQTSPSDEEEIRRAYAVALKAHKGQKRASGEPHINHSLAVATIMAGLGAPTPTIVAGLLHDTVEDTDLTLDDIKEEFGPEISQLVDGVTKLTHLPRVSRGNQGERPERRELANETLRKTFLAMGDDVRVVVIKLADRLHNMRTLSHLSAERRERIALETIEIFAPLASRLGIWQVKWELEDLAFRYVHPDEYKLLADQVAVRRVDREQNMNTIRDEVHVLLKETAIEAEVEARPKHLYSIFRKMERKGVPFEEVYDVRGVRVLVNSESDCYLALGVIHNRWKPVPGTFDDYIATPKDNFYQSLHTAVIYDEGGTVEVQIRTSEMDENAEFGIAAHWRYKEGRVRDDGFERRVDWLRSLMEWRQDVTDADDFVEAMKSDVFKDRVYVFTPHGDIIDLPVDSTPIDFAYHIHTEIGHRCRGARVNGKLVSLDTNLKTGDSVEILTTKRGGPSRDWLNPSLEIARSQRARSKIRQWFRKQDREQNISHGRELVEREVRRLGIQKFDIDQLAEELKYTSGAELLAAVGVGDISLGKIVNRAAEKEQSELPVPGPILRPSVPKEATEVSVLGLTGLLTNLGRCCNPVPGDPIIGYVTRGRGATIHRQDCPNVLRIRDKERLVSVSWGKAKDTYPVSVQIRAYDRDGLMRDVSTLVSNEGINMSSIHVSTVDSLAIFDLVMGITDLSQLSRVLNRLEALPNVLEARRIQPG